MNEVGILQCWDTCTSAVSPLYREHHRDITLIILFSNQKRSCKWWVSFVNSLVTLTRGVGYVSTCLLPTIKNKNSQARGKNCRKIILFRSSLDSSPMLWNHFAHCSVSHGIKMHKGVHVVTLSQVLAPSHNCLSPALLPFVSRRRKTNGNQIRG